MPRKEYLFFVCTTPFQLSYVDIMVRLHFPSRDFYKVLYSSVLLDKRFYNDFDEVFIADKKHPIKKFVITYKALKLIKHISNKNEVRSFFSHTGGLVANFCYQVLVLRKGYSFSLFYEGILSFYEYREQKSKKHDFRKFVSFFYGFKYVFRELVLPLESDNLCSVFTPFPEFTLGQRKKMIETPLGVKKLSLVLRNVLIIGSVLHSKINKQEWLALLQGVNNMDNIDKVFFKKHPNDKKNFLRNLINDIGLKYIEIKSEEPVEMLIEQYSIAYVYSSQISSALFNIKSIYRDSNLELYYSKQNNNDSLSEVIQKAHLLGIKESKY